jgi:hypothetical protein
MNHLDQSKVRGNWSPREDAAIFEYVLSEGKKWSKLVAVLHYKRTEHTIKNRFNAIIAKNRRYKFEKEAKVAARILQQLTDRMQNEPSEGKEDSEAEEDNADRDSGLSHQLKFKEEEVSVSPQKEASPIQ